MENADYEAEQAIEKPGKSKQAAESLMIPKHRFDCVNICLKETKQALKDKAAETDAGQVRIAGLEKALLDSKIDTALAIYRAKNLTAVKALINFSGLKLGQDGTVPGLEDEILRIKKSQSYLFENERSTAYVLIPVHSDDSLNKSIANYIKNDRRAKK